MSEITPRLGLPLVAANQAQKHVPVNEALIALDALVQISVLGRSLTHPPEKAVAGDRYIVGQGASDVWTGKDGWIACFNAGWTFTQALEGWLVWDAGAKELLIYSGESWQVFSGQADALNNITRLGVGTQADEVNPFSAKLNNALWTAREIDEGGTGDLRYVMNKQAENGILSLQMQTGYSARAEIGLIGDDDLVFKVSNDGSAWKEAFRVDGETGRVTFPEGGVREQLVQNRTYYVRPDGNDANSGRADTSSDAFLTIQRAFDVIATLDLGGFAANIAIADGTYTSGLIINKPWVGGNIVISGSLAAIVRTNGSCISSSGPLSGVVTINGLKLEAAGSNARAISHTNQGVIQFSGAEFGACVSAHILAGAPGAIVRATGNYTISGPSPTHWAASNGGYVNVAGRTISVLNEPAFSTAFANISALGLALINSNTFMGAATGARYSVTGNGVAVTGGGGANYLPGTLAGSTSAGGQYL